MSEKLSVCTFIYGGSGHVVKTQGCIHVIHVLQESKEILHLHKRDTLHKTGRFFKEHIFLQFHYNPVKKINQ